MTYIMAIVSFAAGCCIGASAMYRRAYRDGLDAGEQVGLYRRIGRR